MLPLSLYPEPLLPTIEPAPAWNPFGGEIATVLAATWLETLDGLNYAHLTAYLLRAYGYPNLPAYDTFNHGHCWGLATEGGHVLRIACPPLILANYAASKPGERGVMIRTLAASGFLSIVPVAIKPDPLDTDFLTELVESFRDPVYIGEQGFDACGLLPPDRDVGPGSSSVRRGGAATGNLIVLPRVVREEDSNTLRIVEEVTRKISFGDRPKR